MKTLLIITAVLASAGSAHAGLFDLFSSNGLKEPLRTSFIKTFVDGCAAKNRTQIFLNYCICAAEKAADIVTPEEANSSDELTYHRVMAKLEPVAAACIAIHLK